MSEKEKGIGDAPKPPVPERRKSASPVRSTSPRRGPPPKRVPPGVQVFSALGPPNIIPSTRHLSLDKTEIVEPPANRFSIYDIKAVKRDILTIFDASENGDTRAITKFSKVKNFDVDAKDRYGRTALIWASDCGHIHAVETLIRLSANIHATDNHTGRTAIHWAARAGNLPIVRLLVTYGADFCLPDRYGLTPLFLARSKGAPGEEVFKYLLGEGAPYNETGTFDIDATEAEIAAEMAEIDAAKEVKPSSAPAPAVPVADNSAGGQTSSEATVKS